MKPIVFITVLISVFLFSCATVSNESKFTMVDVTVNNNIELSTPNGELPYGIYIAVLGEIDGNAIINVYNSVEKIYTFELEKGIIKRNLGSDWYDNVYRIEYIPLGVSNGNIEFLYEFRF